MNSKGLTKKPEIGDIFEAQVEKMAIGGSGVCRINGFVVFVPNSAPLDQLKIKVTKVDDRFGFGEILEVLKPSPHRRAPPCNYANDCGGCSWQQITEEEQLHQKQILLEDLLQQFLPQVAIPTFKIVPSPKRLHYRNRVQPYMSNGRLGFRMRRSHDFIEVKKCLLVEDLLLPYFEKTHSLPDGRYELRILESNTSELVPEDKETSFSFSQVNRFQNEDLKKIVLEWTQNLNPQRIIDLYCGSGNFTEPIAQQFKNIEVIGVEADGNLVKKAKSNPGKRKNSSYFVSYVANWLKRNPLRSTDLIILDPPRAGLDKLSLQEIASAGTSDIIYISCHPVSLARDLKEFLKHNPNIVIGKIQPFEMFPQTDHFETIVHLKTQAPTNTLKA